VSTAEVIWAAVGLVVIALIAWQIARGGIARSNGEADSANQTLGGD
jgi:hypothetical protein